MLIKYRLEVGNVEQRRRFDARITDPRRQWKFSPTDLCSPARWFEYSQARDIMFKATNTEFAPWYIVPSDDKRRARLNLSVTCSNLIPYERTFREKVETPERDVQGAYDDQESLEARRFVAAKF